ncbi:MAG: AMP-binding protein, partial [Candidatus Aminicenantes bacterium]
GAVFSKSAPPGRRRQNTPAKQTAYIIYTSGSSGKPKGVPITHSNFSPLIHWGYGHLGISSKDRALQNLSYYFDWSVWEIFITLTTGASLYMVSQEIIMNPGVCLEFIHTHALTILHITPTHYGYLVNTGKPMKTLRYLFIGAEKLTYDLVKRSIEAVNPGCRIFNMYGPTEATIISAVLEIHRSRVDEYKELSSVPIGRPSGSTCLLVLDKYLKLCPVRAAGELYIGGEGVANGYLNNPELTAESFCLRRPGGALFVKNFLLKMPGNGFYRSYMSYMSYIYKTGDLARWLIDGNVEFLGRIDHQVKIRGYRMELGEIENHLLNYPGIKEAVVAVKGNHHEKYLCAYIVPGNAVDQKKLKNALSKFLPDYMIPSYFIQVERMPLTPNKKIDLKALPEPTITADMDYTAPANNIEKKLVEIWSGILGIERELISTNADFFQLGGHSLKATLLAARIEKELHAKVPLPEIFITPTIRGLAEFLKHAQEFKFESITPTEKKEYYPLSSAQRRLFVLQQMDEQGIGYNMPSVWQLQGNLDVEKFEKVFHRLIRRHEILRTSFIVINDEPVQRIDDKNHKLQITNKKERSSAFQYPDPKSQELRAKSYIHSFIRPFDLSRAPLLRVGLIKVKHTPSALRGHPRRGTYNSQEGKEDKYFLLVDMHHIISDELSTGIFIREFTSLYTGKRLPGLRLQYKDYSQWHNRQAQSERMKEQEIYWLKQFEGEAPVLNLPTDFPRPSVQSFEGRTLHFQLDDEDNLALKRLARAEGATLFMILLALYSIFLSKVCSQEDL